MYSVIALQGLDKEELLNDKKSAVCRFQMNGNIWFIFCVVKNTNSCTILYHVD